ncbi:hypothetical protein VC77_18020 [Vibrio cholerae]|nr:hypothetical protein VC77_18020 [Vibrio cholerae]
MKGLIGLCSYIAASAQELISASLITVTEVEGVKHYDFGNAQYFWLAAGVVSVLLALTVWNAKKVVDIDEAEGKPLKTQTAS